MKRLLVLTFALVLMLPAAAQPADLDRARSFIQQLGDEALSSLARPDVDTETARTEFRDLLHRGFDVPGIGRFVLGRYWRAASEAQQRAYLGLFEEMIVETYARRFRDYSGETFEITGARDAGEQDILVRSRIVRPGGAPPVAVDWRVRDRDGTMKIIDVFVENVSMSVTQRDEFGAVIQRAGGDIDALLNAMRRQIDETRSGG